MLQLRPESWLSRNLEVRLRNIRMTTVKYRFMSAAAEFHFARTKYECRPTSLWATTSELTCNGHRLARARRSGWFGFRFDIEMSGHHWQLKPDGYFEDRMVLRRGHKQVGVVSCKYWPRKRIVVRTPPELSLPEQVFLAWLADGEWSQSD